MSLVGEEKFIRKQAKEKGLRITQRERITITDPRGDKVQLYKWEDVKKFVEVFDINKPEIFSPVCAFGSDGTEEVNVKMCDCPIKRETGKRMISEKFGSDKKIEVTCCIMNSPRLPHLNSKCPHYKGITEVDRPHPLYGFKDRQYKINCLASNEDI